MRTAIAVLAVVSVTFAALAPACSVRDCPEDRAGQLRCVGNRLERCNDDGTLSYQSCSTQGLVCSEALMACVTDEVANTTSAGGSGGGGSGGSAGSTAGGAGGS